MHRPPYAEALRLQQVALRDSRNIAASNVQQLYKDLALLTALGLVHAEPFFWGEEPAAAVMAAGESVPGDTKLSMWNLPTDSAWWYFEKPVLRSWTIDYRTKERILVPVRAMLLFWAGRQFNVTPWADSEMYPGTIFPCCLLNWPEGHTIEQMSTAEGVDVNDGSYKKAVAMPDEWTLPNFIVAALAWLDQKVVSAPAEKIERARRREYQKAVGGTGDVRVVQLRRAEGGSHGAGEGHFTCRWVVGGHWRQQPCGVARADRRLTWVHPYLKGPDGMPLREPRPKMYAVVR